MTECCFLFKVLNVDHKSGWAIDHGDRYSVTLTGSLVHTGTSNNKSLLNEHSENVPKLPRNPRYGHRIVLVSQLSRW